MLRGARSPRPCRPKFACDRWLILRQFTHEPPENTACRLVRPARGQLVLAAPVPDGKQVKDSLRPKLMELVERHEEVARLLGDTATISDKDRFRELSKEYARLDEVAHDFTAHQQLERDIAAAGELRDSDDAEMASMADDEHKHLAERLTELERKLLLHLVPKDPDDDANLFLEVRAGTGGDEAAIFAGDLFRMYSRYAERRRWHVEILSEHPGEHGGYKE